MVPPSIASIGLAALLCFLSVFALGIPYGFSAPIPLSLGALAASITVGALCYGALRARLASGRRDLVLDPVRRVLTLPPCVDRGSPEVPYGRITGVAYRPGSSTRNGVTSTAAILRANGGEYRLVERHDREEALAIGNWVLAQTGHGTDTAEALPDAAARRP